MLFDFDGVIVDSEPIHYESWLDLLEPLGIQPTWEWFQAHCIGIADVELFDTIASLNPTATGEQVRRVYPAKTARYRESMRESPPFAPGIGDLLKDLKSAGLRYGLVTSSSREEVIPIVAVGGLNFNHYVFGDEVQFRKPHPEPYLKGAAALGASRILAIEDSEHGANSALAAGLEVLRIANAQELDRQLRSLLVRELT
ncbi:MAG: HAD family phosphatase [Bryobacteraceae bacterium]|nr:HAD family phosphatase [Bryobacteraceae bacterium]